MSDRQVVCREKSRKVGQALPDATGVEFNHAGDYATDTKVQVALTKGRSMRLRPQFSLRTMFVLVTFVCLYFGLWEATKHWGIAKPWEVMKEGGRYLEYSSQAVGPLIVRTEHSYWPGALLPLMKNTRYELWLFGPRFTICEWQREAEKPRSNPLYYLEFLKPAYEDDN